MREVPHGLRNWKTGLKRAKPEENKISLLLEETSP
jgi:hypothetical protein